MSLLCVLGSFLKVNVQNENTVEWQKFHFFFFFGGGGVLDIPIFFWRQSVDAGPNPTLKKK